MTRIAADLRHALRMIARMPGLAACVVGSLAIGIGANGVVFSWMQSVVFNPIDGAPRAPALQLVEPRNDAGLYVGVSWPEYRDMRAGLRTLDGLLAFQMMPLYVGPRGAVERSSGLLVSDNYFSVLGLVPALGRFPRADEVTTPGTAPVVVISDEYWQTRYGGAADALGRTIRVNGTELSVVGVAPRGFNGTVMRLTFDFWIPATMGPVLEKGASSLENRAARGYSVAGALAPGATIAQARAEVDTMMRRFSAAYPATNRGVTAEVLPFWESPRGPQRLLASSLVVLQALMLLLLLAVCGNTANLLLARATARQREMSIRLALGAPRRRITALLLSESLLLSLTGAVLGAALAAWGTKTLSSLPPLRVRGIPVSFQTHTDLTTMAFAIALGVACGLTFGLLPAWQLSRLDPQATLRSGGAAAPRHRLRLALMGVEVALASMVLIAGGLFLKGFIATRYGDTGFRKDGVLLAGYDLSGRATSEQALARFTATLLERLPGVAGVESAAMATSVPLDIHGLPLRAFALEGHARSDDGSDEALTNTVTPGYFAVMGIPLLAGRDFADLRDTAAPPQVIVNDAFVRQFAAGSDPLGRRVTVGGRAFTIAAVVRTSIYNAFGEPPTPILYFSLRDRPSDYGEIHVRARRGSETAVAADLRRVVREIDPDVPVFDVQSLSDQIESNLIFRRIPARLFSVLAPLLLLLAASGIAAVVGYSVSLRSTDIGVRLALGGTVTQVMTQLVREHLSVVAVGALAGWLLTFAVVLDIFASPFDLPIFAGVPGLLMAVAAAAAWWPARRVAKVDPVVALRAE